LKQVNTAVEGKTIGAIFASFFRFSDFILRLAVGIKQKSSSSHSLSKKSACANSRIFLFFRDDLPFSLALTFVIDLFVILVHATLFKDKQGRAIHYLRVLSAVENLINLIRDAFI